MCARRQREILESASKMLRAGGRLVYSTCTFAPEENEGVISSFLHDHPEFSIAAVSAPWFSHGRPEWAADPADGLERTFRLWPHLLRGEGHFAAVLQYNGTEASDTPCEPGAKPPAALDAFLRELSVTLPEGHFAAFGSRWFLLPPQMPALRGLKVLRAGLCLGEEKKPTPVSPPKAPKPPLTCTAKPFPETLPAGPFSRPAAAPSAGSKAPAAFSKITCPKACGGSTDTT